MNIVFWLMNAVNYFNIGVWRCLACFRVCLGVMLLLGLAGHAHTNQNNLDDTIDLRVLVDVSGSMKNTDPNNMRGVALQVLAQILPDGMNTGIWVFDGITSSLVPLDTVDASWREEVLKATQNVTATGRFTNIQGALTRGIKGVSNKPQHVILLTDGKVDISNDQVANIRSRNQLLSGLWQGDTYHSPIIHTIALSSNTDQRLLREIARQSDGLHTKAESADQLTQFFLRALDNSHTSAQLEVTNQPDGTQKIWVDEATAQIKLVIKTDTPQKTVVLKDPQGKRVSSGDHSIQIQSLDDQQIITINKPTAGEWQLLSNEATITRVNVINDLAVNVALQHTNLYLGQASQVTVKLASKPGTAIDIEDKITGTIILSLTDEANKDLWQVKVPITEFSAQAGIVSIPVQLPAFNQVGLYHLKTQLSLVQSGTKGFSRSLFIDKHLRVHPPIDYEVTETGNTYVLTVTPLYDQLNLDNSSVTVMTKSADGVVRSKTLPLRVDGWKATWESDQPIDMQSIQFEGSTFAGDPIKFIEKEVELQVLTVQDVTNQQLAKSVAVENLPNVEVMSVTHVSVNGDGNAASNSVQGVSAEAPSSALQDFINDTDVNHASKGSQADAQSLPVWVYGLIGGLMLILLLLLWRFVARGRLHT